MAKKRRKVIKLVPATTANLTTGTINYIRDKGYLAERIHNGAVFDPRFNGFRKKRKDDGSITDVVACIAGRFVAIEIKNSATGDKPSEGQLEFRNTVLRAGGIHIWGRDLNQIKYYLYTEFPFIFRDAYDIEAVPTGGTEASFQQLESGEQKRNAATDHRRRENRNIRRHAKEIPGQRSPRSDNRTP